MSQVTIKADVTPVVSYAMAHTRISPVTSVEITNSGAACQGARLSIEVRDGQGVLSRPWERALDLAADASVVLADVPLALAPDAMGQVEEARPGSITFEVTHDDEMLGRCEEQVDVLAGHQWLAVPPGLAEELLAAHVMPNAPQITALMPRAAELVGGKTGRATLDGYQSEDPTRIDALAASVFEALRERGIHYAEPPASWADVGQKVRTPAEVIEGRLGTCLDTCVVLAAALEQAGVRPQIWLLKDHALLGYWRTEMNPAAVTYDAGDLMNFIDLGLLSLVETTLLTHPDASFPDAVAAASRTVRSDLAAVMRVLDVYAARRNHILPLPAITREGGVVQVVEYRPAVHSVAPDERARETPSVGPVSDASSSRPMPARVQQWKNALLDLSLRNRLINFSARNAVQLHTAPAMVHALEDHLSSHRLVTLRPSDDIPDAVKAQFGRTAADLPEQYRAEQYASHRAVFTNIGSDAYLTRLRSLAYKARTLQEETGANNLYLALGSLVWDLDGRALRSPLILVPLVLKAGRGGGLYQITGDEAGQSTPNYCLLERLRQSFGLTVPGLENPASDGSGIDLAAAFSSLREALALKGLRFHVEETADIAVLQFAKYRLWKDIDDSWEQLLEAPLVRHLALTPTEEFVDPVGPITQPDLEGLATSCPIPADGSQLTAIAEALAGRTFVLEGPPGTGKSQTIANLLSRAIAEGKKVLFVAEKRAALDVVSRRINAVGLGDFTLDLHDKLSKPAAVRRQVAHALDYAQRGDQQGVQAQIDIAQSSGGVLDRYAKRLHQPNASGLSLYGAETQRLALADDANSVLPVPEHVVQSADGAVIEELRAMMRRLPEVADPAAPSADAPWLFVQADRVGAVDVIAVGAIARQLDDVARWLRSESALGRVACLVRRPDEAAVLARIAHVRPPLGLLDEVRQDRWRSAVSDLRRQVAQFRVAADTNLPPAAPAMLGLPLSELLSEARAAATSFFIGRGKRQLAVLAKLGPGLAAGAPHRKELVAHLERWTAMKAEALRLAAVANSIPGIRLADGWNPLAADGLQALDGQVTALEEMATCTAPDPGATSFVRALRAYVGSASAAGADELAAVEGLRQAITQLPLLVGATPEALANWAGAGGFLPRWASTSVQRQSADPDLRSLARWVALREYLAPLARHGLREGHEMILTGRLASDDAVLALERGLAAASLSERRRSQGLDAFDPVAHQRTVTRFIDANAQIRSMLPTVLPMGAVARRTFAHDSTAGLVGRLRRELTRQRGGLSVRELMRHYGDLITEIMPCVLVSPDSVARFLPVGAQVFDIVVFDEASQIRVADAVGAIGRGRSVVVVGDSKQMPPTSFAEVSWRSDQEDGDDYDNEVVEDEESILSECVQARLRRQWLTWHYRSQDESLIAFSNAHYYDGKLSSFPSPVVESADRSIAGHGISLVRVDGQFLRTGGGKLKRTNPVEAQAVVDEIKRRFAAAPAGTVPSIGVVTFNQPQRAHIEGLLRDSGDERVVQALESPGANGLFVKNLENVQGDERDVILFSTAFSVNERGVLPLNFGPLNRSGGERRLNVAITRARRQVILFSSFDPVQLRAEETSSVGIKHLRSYLDVAASGTGVLERTVQRTLNTDRHRDEVAEALRARGLVVSVDVGLSDFRVDLQLALPSEPDRPLAAVLLDSVLWANRLTVSDRDAMPADILRDAMRWPAVERVWLPEWLADPDGVLDRLEHAVRAARRVEVEQDVAPLDPEEEDEVVLSDPSGLRVEDGGSASVGDAPRRGLPVESEPETVPALRSAAAATAPQSAVSVATDEREFVPWLAPVAGGLEVLDGLPHDGWARSRVGTVLRDAIEAEGPVHRERLAKLVAGAFGLQRVAGFRIDAILSAAPGRPDSSGFYWPSGVDRQRWTNFRRDPRAQRPLEHVSEVEIANAMREQCARAHAMTEDELFTETLRVFGYKRRTAAFVTIMRKAIDVGADMRRLERSADGLYRSVDA